MTEPQQYADALNDIWSHLPDSEREDQIEAHMESEGFTQNQIDAELERLGLLTIVYTLKAYPPVDNE